LPTPYRTADVLADLGYSGAEVAALRAAGTIVG